MKTFIFLFCLIFTFPAICVSQQSNGVEAQQKKSKGETYFRDEGEDLDKLIERQATVDGVANFSIEVSGDLPMDNAKVSLYSFDVDEERGETNKVYFNGHYLGNLSGTNDTWNTTVFDIELSWIKKGRNKLKVLFTDSSKSGRIKWTGKIAWVQMLVDGGAAEEGEILIVTLGFTPSKGTVKIASNLDIIPKKQVLSVWKAP